MRFRPFIFIDTNFTRTSQPVWMLAVLEPRRRIDVRREISKLPLEKQIPLIQRAIRRNYATTGGTIPVWGKIAGYRYYYKKKKYLSLTIQGELLGKRKGPLPSQAKLSIEGQILTMIDE